MCFCPTRARPGELPGSRISRKQRHGSPRWCLCWSSSWASKERWPCAEANVFRVTRQKSTSWTQWERETASMPDFSHTTYKGRICKPALHRETWQVPFQPRWLEARRRFGIESVGRSFGGNAATSLAELSCRACFCHSDAAQRRRNLRRQEACVYDQFRRRMQLVAPASCRHLWLRQRACETPALLCQKKIPPAFQLRNDKA